jgi:DNA-binding SARP family transcriptional activator
VRILGTLQVEDGSRIVAIDSPKERALLEVLTLHSTGVVPVVVTLQPPTGSGRATP